VTTAIITRPNCHSFIHCKYRFNAVAYTPLKYGIQFNVVHKLFTEIRFPYMHCFSEPFIDKSSAVAKMDDRLATIDMGLKVGGCCAPFFLGELGPHLTKWRLDLSSRLATT